MQHNNTKIKTAKTGKQSKRKSSLLGAFLIYFLLSLTVIVIFSYFAVIALSRDLPDHKQLETKIVKQKLSTFIYSRDGVLLRTVSEEEGKRFWVPYDDIPQWTIDAFLAAEDQRFFQHWGLSLRGITRAFVVNFKAIRFRFSKKFPYVIKYTIKEGGSTITQQLAREIFLDRKQSLVRKLKEAIVALNIEHAYSKSEILEFFLNRMPFSYPSLGIQAAALQYFGKNASELGVGESALLAGILQGPTRFNPRRGEEGMDNATAQRNKVLRMMVDAGKISPILAKQEREKPIVLGSSFETDFGKAPFFVEYVTDKLNDRYGESEVKTEGLKVWTTLDYRLQQVAEDSLFYQLDKIQKEYAAKIRYTRPSDLTDAEAVKDSLRKTQVQGALVAIDIKTGKILAMIGGRKFDWFNRATDAKRQAGSSFKPFVYTAALDNGWRCCDVVIDSYFKILNPDRATYWEPENFEKDFMGPLSLRDAIKISRNVVAIKLVNDYENRGIGPDMVVKYAHEMGLSTRLYAVPSLAIGTSPVKLIEMVSAYTIFPNHGIKTENFAIEEIQDKNKTVIYSQPGGEGAKREVLSPATASLMLTMLESVTTEGTASNIIRLKGMSDRPCAGKTGTGNDYKDAWFIGVTPYIACGVWIGFDSEETTLGSNRFGTGAIASLPVWVGFIKAASDILGYPKDPFEYEGITTLKVCMDSYLKSTSSCPDTSIYTEYFIQGTEITDFCDVHKPVNRLNGRF